MVSVWAFLWKGAREVKTKPVITHASGSKTGQVQSFTKGYVDLLMRKQKPRDYRWSALNLLYHGYNKEVGR